MASTTTVDVNVKATPASNEVTPLHVAVMCGHLACLQLLVQSGGDVMALDSNNLTASDYAIREGQMFCLGYLEEQIGECGGRLMGYPGHSHVPMQQRKKNMKRQSFQPY